MEIDEVRALRHLLACQDSVSDRQQGQIRADLKLTEATFNRVFWRLEGQGLVRCESVANTYIWSIREAGKTEIETV